VDSACCHRTAGFLICEQSQTRQVVKKMHERVAFSPL